MLLLKYNQDRTLKWLRRKYGNLFAKFLEIEKKHKLETSQQASCTSFVFSQKKNHGPMTEQSEGSDTQLPSAVAKGAVMKKCFAFLAEYVSKDVLRPLFAGLQQPDASNPQEPESQVAFEQLFVPESKGPGMRATAKDEREYRSDIAFAETFPVAGNSTPVVKSTLAEKKRKRMEEEKKRINELVKMKSISSFFKR